MKAQQRRMDRIEGITSKEDNLKELFLNKNSDVISCPKCHYKGPRIIPPAK